MHMHMHMHTGPKVPVKQVKSLHVPTSLIHNIFMGIRIIPTETIQRPSCFWLLDKINII